MIFATFQPIKANNRNTRHNRDIKIKYSFCKKPVFAIGYEGNPIDFVTQLIFASPQKGEKLVLFESDKYIKINKMRWHCYLTDYKNTLFDYMQNRTALENDIYEIQKETKPNYNEYVVSKDDIKKIIFEIKLKNADGTYNLYENSKSDGFQKLLTYCSKYIEKETILYDFERYNYLVETYVIGTVDKASYDEIFTKEFISINNEQELLISKTKLLLSIQRWFLICMIFPYILMYSTKEPRFLYGNKYEIQSDNAIINTYYDIKLRYHEILAKASNKNTNNKSSIKKTISQVNNMYNDLCNYVNKLFYVIDLE